MKTDFFRILDASDKASALRQSVRAVCAGDAPTNAFAVTPEAFKRIPRAPFAYWAPERVREIFSRCPAYGADGRDSVVGLKTSDDARFVRLKWEVPSNSAGTWRTFVKGGRFSRFYRDQVLRAFWAADGAELWAYYEMHRARTGGMIKNPSFYFRPGMTWTPRTQKGFGMAAMPRDCIFGNKGPAAFVEDDSADVLLPLLAVTNSGAFAYLLSLQMAFGSFEVGTVLSTPIPRLSDDTLRVLGELGRSAWSAARSLDAGNECSDAFLLPWSLLTRCAGLEPSALSQHAAVVQREIEHRVAELYGLPLEDFVGAQALAEPVGDESSSTDVADTGDEDPPQEDEEDEASEVMGADALNCWLVGVAFGRFDPRLATGERAIPPEPEPFDPLPSRSPGMYPEGEEPADRPDILVDDEGHAADLAARAIAVAERVKVDAPENVRAWLAKEFFPLHIKMYSKSRRKAPIYWQLATPSASYSVWLYTHAFSKDTLFRVQNDYVAPKLAHEERRLESLTSELRDGATAAQRKTLAAQEAVVDELRAFLDEVKRVAPLWKPNLDDGVIINFAPLWRLVPQNKSWQRELKSAWDALCEGKYDWAHLAMHFWPERVVPKCAKDRSLAIAHGLEDVFWVEGTDGKWTARKAPTRSVDELVRERTSPAVKSALKSLLEAPAAAGKSGGRRGGGRRKSAAAAEGGDA